MYGLINGLRSSVAVATALDMLRRTGQTVIGRLTVRDRPMAFNLSGDMIFYTVCYTKSAA
jgi:hypothetical protein